MAGARRMRRRCKPPGIPSAYGLGVLFEGPNGEHSWIHGDDSPDCHLRAVDLLLLCFRSRLTRTVLARPRQPLPQQNPLATNGLNHTQRAGNPAPNRTLHTPLPFQNPRLRDVGIFRSLQQRPSGAFMCWGRMRIRLAYSRASPRQRRPTSPPFHPLEGRAAALT